MKKDVQSNEWILSDASVLEKIVNGDRVLDSGSRCVDYAIEN